MKSLHLILVTFILIACASTKTDEDTLQLDIEADRAHPIKKNRPLPSNSISKTAAVVTFILLLLIIGLLLPNFNLEFIICVAVFIVLNILYTFYFKHVVILDVFSIAAGFSLRVLAGAFVINVPISSWLLLTTMFISLFLGVMKRHSELTLVPENENSSSRKVLAEYSLNFANQMATVAAAGVIICYALYTVAPRTVSVFSTENLIYTTPFVVFGIFRYMYLEYMSNRGENTTKIISTDSPMIVTVVLYIITTVLIIYHII